MNLLVETAPDYIVVGGEKLKLKTDFQLWVKFILACSKQDQTEIIQVLSDIFEKLPETHLEEFVQKCTKWLYPPEDPNKGGANSESDNRDRRSGNRSGTKAFDFEEDGNIIYCELWQYFPRLMERGISFHEGIELIKILMSNENTNLWHRAFARCGDFSKMTKEQKRYWQKQRAIYSIKLAKNADVDVMCKDF